MYVFYFPARLYDDIHFCVFRESNVTWNDVGEYLCTYVCMYVHIEHHHHIQLCECFILINLHRHVYDVNVYISSETYL